MPLSPPLLKRSAWRHAGRANRRTVDDVRGHTTPRRYRHASLTGLILLALLSLMIAWPAYAEPGFSGLDPQTLETLKRSDQRPKHDDEADASAAQSPAQGQTPAMSSSQAARIAREREGGRVLNVILEQGPSGPYYRVKILEQGRVQVVHIDAR